MFDPDYIPYDLLAKKVPDVGIFPCGDTQPNNKDCWENDVYDSEGKGYYRVNGDLTTPTLGAGQKIQITGNKKLIILVSGNFAINANIQVSDDSFLMIALENGNTTVNELVTTIEGLYYVDGDGSSSGIFYTGSKPGAASDDPLILSGIFIAKKFELERDLGNTGPVNNSNTPAESFYYKPSLLFTAPSFLMARYTLWEEVAP